MSRSKDSPCSTYVELRCTISGGCPVRTASSIVESRVRTGTGRWSWARLPQAWSSRKRGWGNGTGVHAADVTSSEEPLPPTAWRGMAVVCALLAVSARLASTRYGYHRDELYFIVCGRHLAVELSGPGFAHTPVGQPFEALGHGSLVVFRLPAVASVVAASWGDGELEDPRAWSSGLLAGHLVSTATLDFALWVVITWVVCAHRADPPVAVRSLGSRC